MLRHRSRRRQCAARLSQAQSVDAALHTGVAVDDDDEGDDAARLTYWLMTDDLLLV